MIFDVTRSIYSIPISAALLTGTKYIPPYGITMNEALGIPNDMEHDDVDSLNLYTIGRPPTFDDPDYDNRNYHTSELNSTLIDHMPMFAIEKHLEFSGIVPDYYRLRREEIIDGKEYIFYYGISATGDPIQDSALVYTSEESEDVSKFIPSEFKPERPKYSLSIDDENMVYVVNSLKWNISFTTTILENIKYANKLKNSDPVVIGEIGICTSKNGRMVVTNGGTTSEISEAKDTVLNYTVKKYIALPEDDVDLELVTVTVELGGMENVIIDSQVREINKWTP